MHHFSPASHRRTVLKYYCNWVQNILPNKSSHALETIAAVGSRSLCCNISTIWRGVVFGALRSPFNGCRALFVGPVAMVTLSIRPVRVWLISWDAGGGVLFPFPRVCLLVWAFCRWTWLCSEGKQKCVFRPETCDVWHETAYFLNVTYYWVKQDILMKNQCYMGLFLRWLRK